MVYKKLVGAPTHQVAINEIKRKCAKVHGACRAARDARGADQAWEPASLTTPTSAQANLFSFLLINMKPIALAN